MVEIGPPPPLELVSMSQPVAGWAKLADVAAATQLALAEEISMPSLGKAPENEASEANLVPHDSEVSQESTGSEYLCLSKEQLRQRGAEIGYRVSIHPSAIIENPEKLTLGDDVKIGPGVCILAAGGVTIGDRTILGPGSRILSSVPFIPSGTRRVSEQRSRNVKILIHEDACIGAGVTVLPGTEIGGGCVIEPNIVARGYIQFFKLVRSFDRTKHLNRTSPIDPGW